MRGMNINPEATAAALEALEAADLDNGDVARRRANAAVDRVQETTRVRRSRPAA